MYDIAYITEASIEAAEIEKRKIWETLTKEKTEIGQFAEHMKLARLTDIKEYWLIMYHTHG